MKNKIQRCLVLAAAVAAVGFFTPNASAQGDPAQFRQDQLERYRGRIEVKSDEDWKKIEPLVGKVMDAQREARLGAGFGGFGGGRGGRGGAGGTGDQAQGGNRNRGGGQPNPDVEALTKALEDKAPADEVKAKLAKVRESRQAKEVALEKAQEDLRKALSPRQEAGAVLVGLLKYARRHKGFWTAPPRVGAAFFLPSIQTKPRGGSARLFSHFAANLNTVVVL